MALREDERVGLQHMKRNNAHAIMSCAKAACARSGNASHHAGGNVSPARAQQQARSLEGSSQHKPS